jgi:hypothetical protein
MVLLSRAIVEVADGEPSIGVDYCREILRKVEMGLIRDPDSVEALSPIIKRPVQRGPTLTNRQVDGHEAVKKKLPPLVSTAAVTNAQLDRDMARKGRR